MRSCCCCCLLADVGGRIRCIPTRQYSSHKVLRNNMCIPRATHNNIIYTTRYRGTQSFGQDNGSDWYFKLSARIAYSCHCTAAYWDVKFGSRSAYFFPWFSPVFRPYTRIAGRNTITRMTLDPRCTSRSPIPSPVRREPNTELWAFGKPDATLIYSVRAGRRVSKVKSDTIKYIT